MLRAAWVVVIVAGCGSRSSEATNDAATTSDSGRDADATPSRPVTNPPPVSYSCVNSVAGFGCEPAADRAGQHVCTDEMIEEFLFCFGPGADDAKCGAARMKYPECNNCILRDWLKVNPDTGGGQINAPACIRKIDPAGTCSGAVNCSLDCEEWVCGECDQTAGSGSTGSTSSSEQLECVATATSEGTTTKPPGACYELAAKDAAACEADARFAPCFVRDLAGVRDFYRGACRDGGDWSKLTSGDAGTSD